MGERTTSAVRLAEEAPPSATANPGDPANSPIPPPAPVVGPPTAVPSMTGLEAWLVTRHADVSSVLADPGVVLYGPDVHVELVANGEVDEKFADAVPGRGDLSLLSSDPPDHTRLRRLVTRAFTPRRVRELEDSTRNAATDLLDALPAGGGVVDLVEALAFPLPLTVICNLLGVPQGDRAEFRSWADATVSALQDPEAVRKGQSAQENFRRYFRELVESKRAEPGEDLVADLVRARDDEDRLTADELHSLLTLLLVGGHETTVNLISGGMLCLLRHPDQLAALQADPSLMDLAVEECVRFTTPVTFTAMRFTTRDVIAGGVTIPARRAVAASLWSANRDPDRFAEPRAFDITADRKSHLAWGNGVHFCLGAALARMEARVAFKALLDRYEHLELAVPDDELEWRISNIRGPIRLPVRLTPRR